MKLIGALGFAGFLGVAAMAHGSSFVIDNFSCSDSVTQTGPGDTSSTIACPGSVGGFRSDVIFLPSGSGDAASTINSDPPAGAITGTIGSGLSGAEVMTWFGTSTPGDWDLPNLDLSGDSVLIEIESDLGGTLSVALGSGSASGNLAEYSTTFGTSSSFVDVLIPLINPTVIGTGANVDDVTAIGLNIDVPAGSTWTIDGIQAVPEPSTLVLMGVCFLGVLTKSLWRRSPRSGS
jgi:hypothetical protein